jgi:hypothetical protein
MEVRSYICALPQMRLKIQLQNMSFVREYYTIIYGVLA